MTEVETIQISNCRHCNSSNTIRHGYTRKGKQRYRCRACGRSFVRRQWFHQCCRDTLRNMTEVETIQISNCRHCNSSNTIRHGYTRKGKQRYRCRACGRSFVRNPDSAACDPARKEEILRAYHERTSLRGLSRIFGVSRNTVTRWLKKSPEPAILGANAGSS